MSPSQRAGLVAASATVPLSLLPTLRRRSATDQGLITGLGAALNYALTATAHDLLVRTARAARLLVGARSDAEATARTTVVADLATAAVATGLLAALPWREDDAVARAAVRAAADRVRGAALAGAVPGALDMLPDGGGRVGAALRSAPGMVALGTGVAVAVQQVRAHRTAADPAAPLPADRAPLVRSLAVGALTASGAAGVAALERRVAHAVDHRLHWAVGTQAQGGLASHLTSTAAIGGATVAAATWLAHRVEASVTAPDADLAAPPTSALVSGGPGSPVRWSDLGREARRFLATSTTGAELGAVLGGPTHDPVRLYIGLRSASDDAGRVALAMAELKRTGALDRSLLVLASPTGSGYVNHTAVSSWEHLTRGDCATLVLQYAARPSILSLDRVDEGRGLNRRMLAALSLAVASRPAHRRPRLVLFGESLGAFTSQDAFLHTGTRGLRACHVDRALWLGTPEASGWARQVRDPARVDVAPDEVLHLTSADELASLGADRAAAARYVLLSHHDDGVTVFGPRLLLRCPGWLADRRSPAVPPQASWSTPLTFLQAGIDAKNAADTTPGRFTSSGHDYRGDLARVVRFAFDLPCSDAELASLESALRRADVARGARWP